MICIPGWGYPAPLWSRACGETSVQWSWGYWEKEKESVPDGRFWIVAHSFGLYLLSNEMLQRAEGVIWYGGFFSQLPFSYETLQFCRKDPEFVLKKFFKRMFFPFSAEPFLEVPPFGINRERLIFDLEKLVYFEYDLFWKVNDFLPQKTICVHGSLDRIISSFSLPPGFKDLVIFPGEGHMVRGDHEFWKPYITSQIHGEKG